MSTKKLFGGIFWLHLILEVISFFSPILFSWYYILLAILLLSVQYFLIGGCILNKWQFGEIKNRTFIYPYLKLIGFNVSPRKTIFFMRVILPSIIFGITLVWQIIFEKNPLIF